MLSTPPATTQSAAPAAIRSAATAIAWSPEEQSRLTVIAGVETGSPARSAAMRATLAPCSASGKAQPSTTSSTLAGSTPLRSSTPRITAAARSSGRESLKPPLRARVPAVRTAPIRNALFMVASSGSVPQRLAGLQHELDPRERHPLAAEGEEGLTLQVQEPLLGHLGAAGHVAAGDDARHRLPQLLVVLADEAAHLEVPERAGERRRHPSPGRLEPRRGEAGPEAGRHSQDAPLRVEDERVEIERDGVAVPQHPHLAQLRRRAGGLRHADEPEALRDEGGHVGLVAVGQ